MHRSKYFHLQNLPIFIRFTANQNNRNFALLDTPIGLVKLPIGMCQVSSVILTAEVGKKMRKGEELSYFQFGGSDVILLFESSSNVSITAQMGVHYKVGTRIGQAFPVV